MTFGEKLKRLRQERNLTQKQLGDLIGIGNSIISFYEVGDRIPSPDVIIKLSRVFFRIFSERIQCVPCNRSP